MPPPNRHPYVPGSREVGKKIRQAIQALENGDYDIADSNQNARTFESLESLGVYTMEDVLGHVLEFLDEIQTSGPERCFCGIGGGKAEFSTTRGFNDVRLFAYHWNSEKMQKKMYLKFGLRQRGTTVGGATTSFTYIHLSCHDDERPIP